MPNDIIRGMVEKRIRFNQQGIDEQTALLEALLREKGRIEAYIKLLQDENERLKSVKF